MNFVMTTSNLALFSAVIEGIVSLLSIYEYRPRYIFMGVMYFVLVRRPEDVQVRMKQIEF